MSAAAARPIRLLLGALVLVSACASAPDIADSAPAARMAAERFLRAANQNDLDTMGSLFGTRDGPVAQQWTKQEVDERMFLLASVLRHTDYSIGAPQIVPGRRDVATRLPVRIVKSERSIEVPWTLVRSKKGDWLIEDVCFQKLTRPEGAC